MSVIDAPQPSADMVADAQAGRFTDQRTRDVIAGINNELPADINAANTTRALEYVRELRESGRAVSPDAVAVSFAISNSWHADHHAVVAEFDALRKEYDERELSVSAIMAQLLGPLCCSMMFVDQTEDAVELADKYVKKHQAAGTLADDSGQLLVTTMKGLLPCVANGDVRAAQLDLAVEQARQQRAVSVDESVSAVSASRPSATPVDDAQRVVAQSADTNAGASQWSAPDATQRVDGVMLPADPVVASGVGIDGSAVRDASDVSFADAALPQATLREPTLAEIIAQITRQEQRAAVPAEPSSVDNQRLRVGVDPNVDSLSTPSWAPPAFQSSVDFSDTVDDSAPPIDVSDVDGVEALSPSFDGAKSRDSVFAPPSTEAVAAAIAGIRSVFARFGGESDTDAQSVEALDAAIREARRPAVDASESASPVVDVLPIPVVGDADGQPIAGPTEGLADDAVADDVLGPISGSVDAEQTVDPDQAVVPDFVADPEQTVERPTSGTVDDPTQSPDVSEPADVVESFDLPGSSEPGDRDTDAQPADVDGTDISSVLRDNDAESDVSGDLSDEPVPGETVDVGASTAPELGLELAADGDELDDDSIGSVLDVALGLAVDDLDENSEPGDVDGVSRLDDALDDALRSEDALIDGAVEVELDGSNELDGNDLSSDTVVENPRAGAESDDVDSGDFADVEDDEPIDGDVELTAESLEESTAGDLDDDPRDVRAETQTDNDRDVSDAGDLDASDASNAGGRDANADDARSDQDPDDAPQDDSDDDDELLGWSRQGPPRAPQGPQNPGGLARELVFGDPDDRELVELDGALVGATIAGLSRLTNTVATFGQYFAQTVTTPDVASGTTKGVDESVMNAGTDEAMRLLRTNRSRIRDLASGSVPTTPSFKATPINAPSALIDQISRSSFAGDSKPETVPVDVTPQRPGLRAELKAVVFGTPFAPSVFRIGPKGAELDQPIAITIDDIETQIVAQQVSSRGQSTFSTRLQ